jgi:hypothetical protein
MEATALAGHALYPNPAVHSLHQEGGNRQAQARPAVFSRGGTVGLGKRLKNQLLFFERNTDSGIANLKVQFHLITMA